jgi:hypothetical protein
MEISLTQTTKNQITVLCDDQFSHTFNLPELPLDPIETGRCLFNFLFMENTIARAAWNNHPKHILLVTEVAKLDSLPWEYLYSPDGFVVLDVAFVQGLRASQRQPTPDLGQAPLHIVAVPSNPIAHDIVRLDIAGEWTRLKESIQSLETAITLERACPPTLEQVRRLVANQRHRVIHFMGHGDQRLIVRNHKHLVNRPSINLEIAKNHKIQSLLLVD